MFGEIVPVRMKKLLNSNLVESELFVTRPKTQELPSSEMNSCSHQNVLVKFIRLYRSSVYAWLLVFKLNGKVRITNYNDAGITYNWVVFNSVLLIFVSIVQSNSSARLF